MTVFHLLMGFQAERVVSFTVLYQVTGGKLRLKAAND